MQGMWCSAFRRHLLTLGNNTTNRIESFNSQVKAELRKRKGIPPSLPELVGILLQIVKRKDADATYKDFRNSATVAMNVLMPEMKPAGSLYNDAGFRLLQSQVAKLKSVKLSFHDNHTGSYAVEDKAKGKTYDLSPGFNGLLECTCTFSCAYGGLPCCHTLFANQQRQLPLFYAKEVPDRWRRTGGFDMANEAEKKPFADPAPNENDESLDFSSADDDCGRFCCKHLNFL